MAARRPARSQTADADAPAPAQTPVAASAGDLDELARLMATWIGLSMRAAKSTESLQVMSDLGLTVPQMAALHLLAFEGPRTVSELSERLELSLSATSSLVQRLFEQSLVTRAEAEHDRRMRRVDLSAQGRKLVERLMKARMKEMRSGVAYLSPRVRVELHGVLEKIIAELTERIQAESKETPA